MESVLKAAPGWVLCQNQFYISLLIESIHIL